MFVSRQILRSLHTTLPRLLRARRANPGAAYQLKELEAEEALAHDPEGFGNMESDFMAVHKTHRQHETEMVEQQERIRQLMIKHKYFRGEKLPNLLTYAEKEQMRLLHARDPNEWTVEHLAESFPTTAEVVEKIIKSKWRPASLARIRKHDESVIKNWEQLRSGTAAPQIPLELHQHLQKFANRKKEDLHAPAVDWQRPALPKPKHQEFLSIISSCNKYVEPAAANASKGQVAQLKAAENRQHRVSEELQPTITAADRENETYLLDKIRDRRKMRLQELKQFKLTPAELATASRNSDDAPTPPTSTLEQRALNAFGNPSGTGIVPNMPQHSTYNNTTQFPQLNYAKKFESNEIVISVEDQKRFEINSIKERVYIPRKVWRKGATYRVQDCYYDDDGELLYRVPGMACQSTN